jgi:hypothetical protein
MFHVGVWLFLCMCVYLSMQVIRKRNLNKIVITVGGEYLKVIFANSSHSNFRVRKMYCRH